MGEIQELVRQHEALREEPRALEAQYDEIENVLAWSLEHDPRQGLEIAAALRSFWSATGRFAVGHHWLQQLLAATADQPADALRSKALSSASNLAFRQGNNEDASRLAGEALSVARQIGDAERIVDALVGLCRVGLRAEDPDGVLRLSVEAREVARQAGRRELEKLPAHVAAEATRMAGNFEGARRLYEESIALNREIGDQHMVTVEMNNLAAVELHEDHLAAAVSLWQQSLRRAHAERDLYLLPYCLMGLGEVATAAQLHQRATTLLSAATEIFDSTGAQIDPVDMALYEKSVAAARQALGERFQIMWDEGRALSVDEVVGLALSTETDAP